VILFLSFFVVLISESSLLAAGEKAGWQADWTKTVETANREGQVNIYYWGSPYVLEAGAFQQKFPRIKVVITSGLGGQLQQRILSERRAGKFLADVHIDGASNFYPNMFRAGAMDPIRSVLVLPEVADESRWWRGRHKYIDAEEKYVFAFTANPNYGTIAYHTKLVDLKELNSYWDFLRPKWKGKIEARDISVAGGGSAPMRFFYYNSELGPAFIMRLFGEMDATLFRDTRQAVDWLASGKFAICFFCPGAETARQQGLPVDSLKKPLKEGAGLSGQVGYIGLLNRPPHPNAAKVFINWFLSREGQISFQKEQAKAGSARDSLRVDIPKDYIPPEDRRPEGAKTIELDHPDMLDMEPVRNLFREAIAKSAKPR